MMVNFSPIVVKMSFVPSLRVFLVAIGANKKKFINGVKI
tara:strand:+ start:158130 stop:158246 length:117 start_codon:yes stop_codon:yes gene_type:complete